MIQSKLRRESFVLTERAKRNVLEKSLAFVVQVLLKKNNTLSLSRKTELVLMLALLFSLTTLNAQLICPSLNSDGVYDKSSDVVISTYHSSVALTADYFVTWGEDMSSTGGNAASITAVSPDNGYNYSGYPIMVAASGNSGAQAFLLTTTGLYSWGSNNEVVGGSIVTSSSFSSMSLPSGVAASDVYDIKANTGVFFLVTKLGHVYVTGHGDEDDGLEYVSGTGSSTANVWHHVQSSSASGDYLSDVVEISGNREAVYVIKSDNTIWTWGQGVAIGTTASSSNVVFPTQVSATGLPVDVTLSQISSYSYESGSKLTNTVGVLGLGSDGRVYGLGYNGVGEIITSGSGWVSNWTAIAGVGGTGTLSNVVFLTSSDNSEEYPSVGVIVNDGVSATNTAYVWGLNDYYSLGFDDSSIDVIQNPVTPGDFQVGVDDPAYLSLGGHATSFLNKAGTGSICFIGHITDGSNAGASTDATRFACFGPGDPAWPSGIELCINTLDEVSVAASTITANPTTIVANGISTSIITVQLYKASGEMITSSDGIVVISTDNGTVGATTDNNDGTYTAVLTSATSPATATVTYMLDGTTSPNTATVQFTPIPDTTAPIITANQAFTYVENQAANYAVGTVAATDNVAVTSFTITGGNTAGYYAIDATTGAITLTTAGAGTVASNDFETTPNSFVIEVTATDAASNSTTTDVTITVTVGDADSDGINDDIDIDDDNDGVLDSDEECYSYQTIYSQDFDSYTGIRVDDGGDMLPVQTDSDNWWSASGGTTSAEASAIFLPGNYTANLDASDVVLWFGDAPAVGNDNFFVSKPFAVNIGDTYRVSFDAGVVANNPPTFKAYISYDNGVSWSAVEGLATPPTDIIFRNYTFNTVATGNSLIFRISNDTQGGAGNDGGINNVEFQLRVGVPCDVDSDGDNNKYDLDSDDDGCSDAYEAGATFDRTTDFKFTGPVGTNGLVDSLETFPDSGIINYTLYYNTYAIDNTLVLCDTDIFPPSITANQVFTYEENQAANYAVGTVVATDNVAVTSFTITGGNTAGYYAINPTTGAITLTTVGAGAVASNDFEITPNSFVIEVTATDAAANSTTTDVTITVTDVDEEDPAITANQAFAYVENQAANYVVGTVAATDNVAVTSFTITGGNTAGYYAIDATTGVITLTTAGAGAVASNDFETTPNSFVIEVTATDAASNSTTTDVTITVTDVDDEDPSITANQAFTYVENQAANYAVGTVAATDNVAVTSFTITGGNTAGYYAIDATTGVITLTTAGAGAVASNDFETTPNSFVIEVTATDAASNSTTTDVTITVTDVDDEDPSITANQAFTYVENQAANYAVGTVAATDNVAVTSFTITGGNTAGYYAIDATTGAISLTTAGAGAVASNDFETTPNSFVIEVTATDAASNSTTTDVTIMVTDSILDNDVDGDGVLNDTETTDGTDPNDPCDFVVASQTVTPTAAWKALDCDTDGLSNEEELALDTDPLDRDTDGDGVLDGTEVTDSTDPNDLCDFVVASQTVSPSTAWKTADCDNDGLPNESEIDLGTDPFDNDTDGDGVLDGTEVTDGTDATSLCDVIIASQTENTGVWDAADCDGDGVINIDELLDETDPTNPCEANMSNSTVSPSDAFLAGDCDGDGVSNEDELGVTITAPADSNDNGIPDYQELNTADTEEDIEVFTLLTPNGDGDNDVMVIRNIDQYPNNSIEIYNRWGVLVYETAAYGSNGNYFRGVSEGRVTVKQSSELPVGTYWYVLKYKVGAQDKQKAGYLYLNR